MGPIEKWAIFWIRRGAEECTDRLNKANNGSYSAEYRMWITLPRPFADFNEYNNEGNDRQRPGGDHASTMPLKLLHEN